MKYSISYVTTNGSLVLNSIIDAPSLHKALDSVRESDDVHVILSSIKIKNS